MLGTTYRHGAKACATGRHLGRQFVVIAAAAVIGACSPTGGGGSADAATAVSASGIEQLNGLWIDGSGQKTFFYFTGSRGYVLGQKVMGIANVTASGGASHTLDVLLPVVDQHTEVILRRNSDDSLTMLAAGGREDLEFVRPLNAGELAELKQNLAGADPLRDMRPPAPSAGSVGLDSSDFSDKTGLDVMSDDRLVKAMSLKRFGSDGFDTIKCIMGNSIDPVEIVGGRYVVGKSSAPPVCGEGLEWGVFAYDIQTKQAVMAYGKYDSTTETALPEIVGGDAAMISWLKSTFPELFEI